MAIVWDCRFEHWLWRLSPKHVEGPIERERSRQRMKARGLRCEYETMGVRVSTTFEQRVIVRKSVCVWEREEDKDTKKLFRVYLWEGREREREREGKSTFTQWEREGTYAHSLSLSLSLSQPRAFADIVCVKERLRADDHWYLKKSREEENLRVVGVESASEK